MGLTSISAKYQIIHCMITWYFTPYTSIIILIIIPLFFNIDFKMQILLDSFSSFLRDM